MACLTLCSCQSGHHLADFGKVQMTEFGTGTGSVQSSQTPSHWSQPTTLAAQSAVRKPAGGPSHAVTQLARTQAASSGGATYAAAPQSAPPAPIPVSYQTGSASIAGYSTLEAPSASSLRDAIPNEFIVKTTAYTHTEPDSLQYGTKSATGDDLKYGRIRSAAADWSRYPVGTRFKIKGLPYEYVVDDYGRALVGTDTIDLYKPNYGAMNQWGARDVGIEVLEWGSFEESKRILEGRRHKPDADHVRKMLNHIEQKIRLLPPLLRDGFRA